MANRSEPILFSSFRGEPRPHRCDDCREHDATFQVTSMTFVCDDCRDKRFRRYSLETVKSLIRCDEVHRELAKRTSRS
jgi:hypothetical protein